MVITVKRDSLVSEKAAVLRLTTCLNRELGLTPSATQIYLHGNVLSVHLRHALTPMARMIARKDAGEEIVQGVYDVLLADCRERLELLALAATGQAVRQIRVAVDADAEAVVVEFILREGGGSHA